MQECIVVTSGKGGVGKSTISTNLAVRLARSGHKVALVDADIGLRNLDLLLGLEQSISWDLVQYVQHRCDLADVLLPVPNIENLFFVPTSQTSDKMAMVPDDMIEVVDRLFGQFEFDYVVIDCPAGIERGFENAVAPAHRSIVVVTPDVSSVRDADRVIDLLQKKRIMDIQLVINRYRPDLVEQGDMLDVQDIWQILSEDVAGVFLESEEVLRSSNCGVPVVMNDSTVLHSLYADAAHRVLGREVPLVDLQHQESNGVWSKFLQWARVQMGA